jgi:photosystem II stability/assembly factor-like uncharacterized protein
MRMTDLCALWSPCPTLPSARFPDRSHITRSLPGVLLIGLLTVGDATGTEYVFHWGNPQPQGNRLYALAFEDETTGYALGTKGAFLRTTDGGVTWIDETSFPGFAKDLRDFVILESGDLLAVGDAPGIYRSTDAGASWFEVPNPSTHDLLDIASITETTLCAVGVFGDVLRSTDSGETWVLQASFGEGHCETQFWWNELVGYVGGLFQLRRTTDGGETWNSIPDIPENNITITDIQFLDSQNGWMLEHFTTYRTTDGGDSWFEKHGEFLESPIYQEEAFFFDDLHRIVITNLEGAQVWETMDDGLHWEIIYQRNETAGYPDGERLGDGTIVMCSTDGDLLRSTDMGHTWINFTRSPGDGERADVHALGFLPDGTAYAGGERYLWLRSQDGGLTWEFPPESPDIRDPRAIAFRNNEFGLAGGGHSTLEHTHIARTTNGGDSWTSVDLTDGKDGSPRSIAIPGDSICYVAVAGSGDDNHVFRSTDAGLTWQEAGQGLPTDRQLYAVSFPATEIGFVSARKVAGQPSLWRTADGAGSWTPVEGTGLDNPSIYDMYWSSPSTGLLATYDGVLRTTDAGVSWTTVVPDRCSEIDFHDPLRGVASLQTAAGVWVTLDGGESWDMVEYPWTGSADDVVSLDDGFGVCGSASVILLGYREASSVEDSAPDATTRVEIIRTLPNPSNGRFHLAFQTPATGPVQLRAVDVHGRQVGLLNRVIREQSSLIQWDLHGLARGVYFVEASLPSGVVAKGRFVIYR